MDERKQIPRGACPEPDGRLEMIERSLAALGMTQGGEALGMTKGGEWLGMTKRDEGLGMTS
jgi:hypothetical protein